MGLQSNHIWPQIEQPLGPAAPEQFYRWLKAMVYEAPGFMAVASGPDHRIEFVNKAYDELFNGRTVIGLTVREALPELKGQGFLEILNRVYATGETYTATEVPVTLCVEPGTPPVVRYQSFVYAPIRNPDGEVVGTFLEGFDVTDSKLARDEVQRLNAELVHVSRASAMSTMAATLAHELNQPLTAALNFLTGSLRMLEDGGEENTINVRAALERAQRSVRHAAATIRALRNVVDNNPWRRLQPTSRRSSTTLWCWRYLVGSI